MPLSKEHKAKISAGLKKYHSTCKKKPMKKSAPKKSAPKKKGRVAMEIQRINKLNKKYKK